MSGPLDLHPKTTGASLAGAVGVLIVWGLGLAHVAVDPVVAASIPTALAGFGAWLAPLLPSGK